jgi:hypothetical protein
MQDDDPKLAFITSDKTIKEIAEQFVGKKNCSYSHLTKRSMREDWFDLRKAYRAKLETTAKERNDAALRGAADKSELAAMKTAEKVGNRLAPQIAMIYEQLLQTAIKLNVQADMVLMSDRIKMSSTINGEVEIDIKETSLSDRLKAGQLHSMAVATVRSLFPRETLEAATEDGITATDEEVLREMRARFGGSARMYDEEPDNASH